MYSTLLAVVLPFLGPWLAGRHYEYRHGCSTGCQHCQSCRWHGYGTCYDYRRYFDYPWHSPQPYPPPPHIESALPDIIRITPLEIPPPWELVPPPVDESSPSDRK